MKLKRWLCVLVTLCMVITVLPLQASAATIASGKCGENVQWTLDSAGALTISGSGPMHDGVGMEDAKTFPWYNHADKIKSVVIKSGVTYIGKYAFGRCSNLESVSIANTVTAIGDSVFSGCSKLKSLTIPDSVTVVGGGLCANCESLSSVTISKSMTEIPSASFRKCTSLTSITIPGNIRKIGYAFDNCTNLSNVTLSEGLEYIGEGAFASCTSLKKITIPKSVTSIGRDAFGSCVKLMNVVFLGNHPNINSSAFWGDVTNAYYPINNPTWTEDVLKDYDGTINWIGVSDPSKVTVSETSGTCGANTKWSFDKSTGTLTISGSGKMEYVPWYAHKADIKKVVINKGVTNICSEAFFRCTALTSVTIPDSVKEIEIMAFAECRKLPSITIPDSVTKIGKRVFDECDSLTSVKLPSKLKTIEYRTFYGCDNLTSVTIPNGVTSIGESAFHVCQKLSSITIPASVTFVDCYAFYGCKGLKSIKFEGPAPEFEGNFIFEAVTATVRYPADLDGWDSSDARAHYNCTLTWQAYCSGKHKSNNETITKQPTCTAPGSKTGVCSVCGVRYTKEIPVTDHTYDDGKVTTAPTCTKTGIKTYTCKGCGKTKTETLKALGHDYSGAPVFDLDSRTHSWNCARCDQTKTENCSLTGTVIEEAKLDSYGLKEYICSVCSGGYRAQYLYRISGANRWETSLRVADEMQLNLGVEKFDAIIIASGSNFADALAGSYLSTKKNAPILLSWGQGGKYEYLDTDNIDYIKNNLKDGGTVYILGGVNAVPELYEAGLEGYDVVRLGGANRFETNILILEEAGIDPGSEILVCTSTNFADSLSASATGKPILLVWNERGELYGDQPEFLASLEDCSFTVIGGENAVGTALMDAIGTYGQVDRLAGANRFETSVLVAQKYFEAPEYAVLAYAWNYPDGLCGGALAYTLDAPLILTMTKYEAQAAEYILSCGIEKAIVLGGESLISDDTIRAIFAMEAETPVAVK